MIFVTVLMVADDQLRSFNYLADDDVRKILSYHVVFGYYDQTRLKALTARTILPTLYQGSTLTANYDGNGVVTFRSANAGPEMNVKLIGTVEAHPHSISKKIVSTARSTPNDESSNNAPSPSNANSINNAPPPPKVKPSINALSPSKAKPSTNPPSESPSKSKSSLTTQSSVAPTEDYNGEYDSVQPSVTSPLKPSSNTPPPAPTTSIEAPASAKSTAPERLSSGNYLASVLMILIAARFLFNII
ncbi:fasciclin-like arabinogalactan protein 3 [Hibiscus syriacus]|uniref:fasciclin-like arabinogalactan protein 3 n=1 Tax=Hibiscus syriacus TaxID=106335 RepID=UPI0019239C57|nr:fasciclin-like arabinogalactan protein 3 [Hibiscus syriacus]